MTSSRAWRRRKPQTLVTTEFGRLPEDYHHGDTIVGFKPCTRKNGHKGPCALPEDDGVRTYGFDKTIHQTQQLDVEVHDGEVVAVWFRCQALPFRQTRPDGNRADEMRDMYDRSSMPALLAVEVKDR